MLTEAKLQEDLKAAMKAQEVQVRDVLRGLLTAIKTVKVEKMVPDLAETDLLGLVRREINKRNEAAEFARKANRPEQEQANLAEKAVLEKYLPAQMDGAALEAALRSIAAELGSTQIGPLMAKLKERHAGQYDGKLASEIAKKLA